MGTQVLPAQDFLIHQNPADNNVFNRRRKPSITAVNGTTYPKQRQITNNNNNNGHRKSNACRHLQNRTAAAPARATINRSASTSELTVKHQKKKQPVMTTLNRVKSTNCIGNISGGGTGGLRNSSAVDYDDWYAGSTFVLSPSPTSLPLPSFFNKKEGSSVEIIDDHNYDDIATKGLRDLLRLT